MIFSKLVFLSLFLLSIFLLTDAGGWGGWNGGGGGNRWKQGGHTTNWRPANNWKNNHNNNNFHNNNNGYYNEEHTNNEHEHKPVVSFTHLAEQTGCSMPSMGDTSKFELRCIFEDALQDGDCLSKGKFIPSGTTAMLKCKHPYFSETGDMRIWVCEDGTWKGEFKSFRCSYSEPVNKPLYIDNSKKQNHQNNQNSNYKPNNQNTNANNHNQNVNNNHNNQNTNNYNHTPSSKPNISNNPSQYPDLGLVSDDELSDEDLYSLYYKKPQPTVPAPKPRPSEPFKVEPDPWAAYYPNTTTSSTTTTTTTTTTTPKPTPGWKPNEGKTCPSLTKRTGIQLECLSKTATPWDPTSFIVSQNDCSTPQPVGAEATYKCQQYYEASLGLSIQYRKCKEDGTWTGGDNGFSCSLECGKSNPVGKTPFITNGEATDKAQWPWHAALFYREDHDPTFEYICGATLITRRAVVTAAHCVAAAVSRTTKSASNFRVDLGRHRRTVDDEFVQTFEAESVFSHPSYNAFIYDSDIALIILKAPVTVGFHVRPICYPQTQSATFDEIVLSPGSVGTAVGFGANEKNELSDVLQMARLKVVSQQECTDSFSDTAFGSALTKSTTFCTGLKNGTNVCNGDSGGGIYFPLTAPGSSRWYLQGLVSVGVSVEGEKRCDPTRNSIFTKLSSYADWIVRILSENDALI